MKDNINRIIKEILNELNKSGLPGANDHPLFYRGEFNMMQQILDYPLDPKKNPLCVDLDSHKIYLLENDRYLSMKKMQALGTKKYYLKMGGKN